MGGVDCAESGLVQQCIGKNVGVYLHGVLDFISATAAAALGVCGIVQAVVGINDNDFVIDEKATKFCLTTGFQLEFFDRVNGAVDFVIQGNVLEAIVSKKTFDFALKGGIPFFVGTGCGGEEEATVLEIFLKVFSLGGSQVEIPFPGHDGEWDFKQLIGSELDGFEFAFGRDGCLLLNI